MAFVVSLFVFIVRLSVHKHSRVHGAPMSSCSATSTKHYYFADSDTLNFLFLKKRYTYAHRRDYDL